MDKPGGAARPPHVLVFPFAAQGHITIMLNLAELLCLSGLHVTFIITVYNYNRLLRYTQILSRFSQYQGFRFQPVPDGLPDEHPRSVNHFEELNASMTATVKPILKEKLASGSLQDEIRGPATCIISDAILSFTLDVAQDHGIPQILFRTNSACAFWNYFCLPDLIQAGELPFEDDDLDVPIVNIRGMEGLMRRRDLVSMCRVKDLGDPMLQLVVQNTTRAPEAGGFILNTFEDLEGPILDQIRNHIPNLYSIGPLHLHLKKRLAAASATESIISNSLWEEDRSCIDWLDKQPENSVIYVSFGSFTLVTKDVLLEFWHGLMNSGKQFLWVIRPDLVAGGEEASEEIKTATKDRGYTVEWAPQEEVLAHPAVGAFLTHSGWNSTIESIVLGVPMICWPNFADQPVNSRFVGEVWKLGLDMKDVRDRVVVEKMVKDLMEVRRDEFLERANHMSELARKSVGEGGSSYRDLDRLVEDISSMKLQHKQIKP